MSGFNTHNYDKLLKRCPFCGGKAKLRSPKRLRSRYSAHSSDVSCTKCCVMKASWPWPHGPGEELPRDVQDQDVIKQWNKRVKS